MARVRWWITISAGVLFAADLWLWLYRGHSLLRDWATLRWTTGLEELPISVVRRVALGGPAYSWPAQALDGPALYNFLFYKGYGFFARFTGGDLALQVLHCRLLTCGMALLGAWAEAQLIRRILRSLRVTLPTALTVAIVSCTWIGSGFVRWFDFTVRPDAAALALATIGLWCAVPVVFQERRRPLAWLVAAAGFFYLAWAMKQTIVSFWLATLILLVLTRRLREASTLAFPFLAGVGLTFCFGGNSYWMNTVVAPGWSPLAVRHSFQALFQGLGPNLFLFVPPLAAIFLPPWLPRRDLWIFPAVALPLNAILLARPGSNSYYLWESLVLLGLFCAIGIGKAWQSRTQKSNFFLLLTAIALATSTAGSLLQAALPNRYSLLDLRLPLSGQEKEARSLPKPVLIQNLTLALQADAGVLVDPYVVFGKTDLTPYGQDLYRAIDEGNFCSLVIEPDDRFGWKTLVPGYRDATVAYRELRSAGEAVLIRRDCNQ